MYDNCRSVLDNLEQCPMDLVGASLVDKFIVGLMSERMTLECECGLDIRFLLLHECLQVNLNCAQVG